MRNLSQWHHCGESGYILTRIERQTGAGRVPSMLATVGVLKKAPDYDPFQPLKLEFPF